MFQSRAISTRAISSESRWRNYTRDGTRIGTCSQVYLIHNDSELKSTDCLDRFESDDEVATDLKRNKSLFYRESERDIGESDNQTVESESDHRPVGG